MHCLCLRVWHQGEEWSVFFNVQSDYNFNGVFRVELSSAVGSILAGTGDVGYANGPGTSSTFYHPQGIGMDAAGSVAVVVSDVAWE